MPALNTNSDTGWRDMYLAVYGALRRRQGEALTGWAVRTPIRRYSGYEAMIKSHVSSAHALVVIMRFDSAPYHLS